MIKFDDEKRKDMNMFTVNNVCEHRIMLPEFFENGNENILMAFLGDDDKLNTDSISVRNELFDYLNKTYNLQYNYWIEISPGTTNVKRIHILPLNKMQQQNILNGVLYFKARYYDVFKFPQLGFSVLSYRY